MPACMHDGPPLVSDSDLCPFWFTHAAEHVRRRCFQETVVAGASFDVGSSTIKGETSCDSLSILAVRVSGAQVLHLFTDLAATPDP